MGDAGDRSNSSSNNEGGRNESSDEASEPATDEIFDDTTHQITDQLIVRESDSSAFSRYTRLPLQDFGVNTIRFPRWTYDNQPHVRLGSTLPWPSNYILGLNQGEQGAARIMHPWDELSISDILNLFSSSIEMYHPPPQESDGVQDTSPHDMPTPVPFNNIRHEPVMNVGDNHAGVDARAHHNLGESTDVIVDNAPVSQAIVGDNTLTTAPLESPHDMDFSIDTNDPHSANRSDAERRKDEHRRMAENLRPIVRNNELTHMNEGQATLNRGIASVNNENVTWSNQTNTPAVDQPITTHSSSPEALDNEPNINNPSGCADQSAADVISSSNLLMPKVQTHIDLGDESSGESTASE